MSLSISRNSEAAAKFKRWRIRQDRHMRISNCMWVASGDVQLQFECWICIEATSHGPAESYSTTGYDRHDDACPVITTMHVR